MRGVLPRKVGIDGMTAATTIDAKAGPRRGRASQFRFGLGVAALALALGAAFGGLAPAGAGAAPDPESARCLALTIYWESRSEGREGMIAVGWVVLNRLRAGTYPSTVCAVVHQGGDQKGCQFSYWCDGNSDVPAPGESWTLAQQIARDLLSDPPPDPTHGAVFYHAVGDTPAWAKDMRRTVTIGEHVYYKKV